MTNEEAITATMEAIKRWDSAWYAQDWSRLSQAEQATLANIGDRLMNGDRVGAGDALKAAHKAWKVKNIMR